MAIVKKTAILVGEIYIPITLHKTTRDTSINFNQLCKNTQQRVRYKKYCPSCEKELKTEDIIKGYEYEKDKYVIITQEELEKIKTQEDKTLHILQFTKMSEIDPIYYNKNYYIVPQTGSEKAFELFRQSLWSKKKVAIAKTVFGTNENLVVISATKEGMMAKTLFYEQEIQPMPKLQAKIIIEKEEQKMLETIISSMTKTFYISDYHDEYQKRLKEAIETKIKGQNIEQINNNFSNNMVNLIEAIKKTVEMSKNHKIVK